MEVNWDLIMRKEKVLYVFSFGCPRSGTTFLQYVLNQGRGYYHAKITENMNFHPGNNPNALYHINDMLGHMGDQVLFVRIKRNPIDIFESFHAARLEDSVNRGLKDNTDEMIYDYIEHESIGVDHIKREFPQLNLIEVKYEDLGDYIKRKEFLSKLCKFLPKGNEGVIKIALNDFDKQFVREGKKSRNITRKLLSADKIKEIKLLLRSTFIREGYGEKKYTDEITFSTWRRGIEHFKEWRKHQAESTEISFRNKVIMLCDPYVYPDPLIIFNCANMTGKVLDIGCGGGLKSYFPLAQYIGIDPIAKTDDEKQIYHGIGENLKRYKDGEIDNIFCKSVLQHSYKPEMILSECFRVLKKKGRLYMTVFYDQVAGYVTHAFTTPKVIEYLINAGFKLVHNFETKNSGYFIAEK